MENTQNTPKKSGGKISYTLQIIGLLPLLALGIAMLFFTSQWFTKTMYQEVERELYDATKSATTLLNAAYPGDYHLEGDVAYLLYKGETDITRDYSLLDQFKEDTGLDITLFYQDTRILTTLYNAQGERIVGSGAPDIVIRDVLNTGENHFYTHTLINGKAYFSYYIPLRNQDGSVVGMLFVGRPSETVSLSIQNYVYPLTWLIIGFVALVTVCIYFYTRRFVAVLLHIHSFLSEVASGNLNATLDHSVTKRSDELGDTGSLFLGGAVAGLAFACEMPLILLLVGLIYIIETLSVILQVTYFKATHGKRLFKMAPIHHHFEMCGWGEKKIVLVFTGITVVLCLLAYHVALAPLF